MPGAPSPRPRDSRSPPTVTPQAPLAARRARGDRNTEDVGERFAEEARRIHYGEAEERGIRGQATPDEAQSLRDEGIEVFTLPLPAALKGTLQ